MDYLRVNTLVKQQGINLWADPNKTLRIVKRKNAKGPWGARYASYLVVGEGDPPGYASWLSHSQVRPLSVLELLAAQAD